jgi:hypothetical protein
VRPFKCPDCGVWWTGLEHRCKTPVPATGTTPYIVVRDQPPYAIGTQSLNSMTWCGLCAGWHIPGAGPCTATYSDHLNENGWTLS